MKVTLLCFYESGVIYMMGYFGVELLKKLSMHYTNRLRAAKDRGLDAPDGQYNWLFRELEFRVKLLRKVKLFIDTIPKYLIECTPEDAIQYVVGLTSPWFTEQYIGTLPTDEDGNVTYFTDDNPYWYAIGEVMEALENESEYAILPLFHMTLCEYIIRNLRLYLFLREKQYPAVDRTLFDTLMSSDDLSA